MAASTSEINPFHTKTHSQGFPFTLGLSKGDALGSPANMLDIVRQMMFDTWAKLKDISKAEARYVAKVKALLAADGK